MLAPTLLFTILLAAKVSHQQIINTDFASAKNVNVCQEMNVRTIFSRVTWATRSCQCTGPYSFRALCRRTYPDPGQQYVGPYDRKCDPRQETASFCLPTEDSDNLFQDCACRKIPTKKGRKTPGKSNGIGCSGGLNLGLSHTSSVYSTIVFAKGTNANDVDGCYIQNSSNGVESAANYPCDLNNNGHVIEFEKGATYQACVEGDNDAPSSISFLWKVVSSVGHGSPSKRDELVQSIKYHKTMARGDIKGTILVEDEDGTELHRFEV